MRLLVYIPEDPGFRQALDAFLAKHPKIRRVEWSRLAQQQEDPVVVVVDPPESVEELRRVDEACRRRLRAAIYIPRSKGDPWRGRIRPVHDYFHPSRRAVPFHRPEDFRRALDLAAKSQSIIRWGALVPMAAIALVGLLLLFVFRDRIARAVAVQAGQAAFGARVDLARLASKLDPGVELAGVAVADRNEPMRNLFEFERLAAGASLGPLLSGRLHVEELALEGLRFGGERKESGALPEMPPPPPPPPPEPAGPTFEQALERLLKKLEPPRVEDLKAVRLAAEIEAELKRREAALRETDLAARIESARRRIEELGRIKPPAAALELEGLRLTPADLLAVEPVSFEEELRAVDEAKAAAEGVEKALAGARPLIDRAKEIQKIEAKDLPRVMKLFEELRGALKTVRKEADRAEAASKGLERSRKSIETKSREAEARAKVAMDRLARSREALGDAGGLEVRIAAARGPLEAWRAEVSGKWAEADRELRGAREEAARLRDLATESAALARQAPETLRRATEESRAELQQRYRLSENDADELLRGLLGDGIVDAIRWGLLLREKLRPLLPRGERGPKPPKARLPAGTRFDFAAREPAIWIKKASFSGETAVDGEPFKLAGRAHDLCSDLSLIGRTARVEFELERAGRRVTAVFNLPPGGAASVELELTGFSIREGRIHTRFFAADASGGTLALRLRIELGEAVTVAGRVEIAGLRLAPDEASLDRRLAVLGEACREVDGIAVDLDLRVQGGRYELKVRSDAAAGLTKKLRGALSKQVETAGREAAKRFDGMVEGPRKQAEAAARAVVDQAPAKVERDAAALDGLRLPPAVGLPAGDPGEILAAARVEWEAFEGKLAAARGAREGDAAGADRRLGGAASALEAARAPVAELTREINAQIERLTKLAR
jgi:hypothetical protein